MPSIDDLSARFARDGAVKESLESSADDENKIHRIDHNFTADAPEPLEELAGCALALGFEHSPIAHVEYEGKVYWSFNVLSDRDTKLPFLTRESILMLALGEAFGVTYDGWGTLAAR
jgi:regulator of RNase E activity RraB